MPAVLSRDEVGGRGDLIGERDLGGGELAAVAVAPAAPVVERVDAGAADRHLALPAPPGAPEAVGDDDREPPPGGRRELAPQPPRGLVGIGGEQQDLVLAG